MSNREWDISEDFDSDPTQRGWEQEGSALDWDNTKEAIGGEFETAGLPEYKKDLPSSLGSQDVMQGLFQFYIENQVANGTGLVGFLGEVDSVPDGFTMALVGLTAYARVDYPDATSALSSTGVSLTQGTKYQGLLHYDPIVQTLYVEIYDLENNPIGNTSVQVDGSKAMSMEWVGIRGALAPVGGKQLDLWVESVYALPSSLEYDDLYCQPFETQETVAMIDQSADLTERQTRNIIKNVAMPKINSWMAAIGYTVPFAMGNSTPPIIRSLTIRLSTYYALIKLYTGHSPNEVGTLSSLKKEIMDDLKRLADCNCGDMVILDTEGNIIEPSTVRGELLSTTTGENNIFDLDDVPDVMGNTNAEEWWWLEREGGG